MQVMTPSRAAFAVLPLLACGDAAAQSYPTKPVRVLVGYPAASGTDIATRLVAAKMSEALSAPFIVDNRPGAAGNIAVEQTARATPDGYTLVNVTAAAAISQSAHAKPPFDLNKDLAAVGTICSLPFILGIHPSLPAKSLREVIALAKARPGQLSYGTSGAGSSPHVAFEMLKLSTGADILHVPYKGTVPAITDTITGQVSMTLANTLTMLPQVKAGRLRAVGITSAKRNAVAPDVPTFAEAGLPGFASGTWFAIMAPGATPREIVARLNPPLVRAVQMPDVREKLNNLGAEPMTTSPEEMAEMVRSEVARIAKVVKAAGIRLD
jgi:tripartite-type tricarboxylate transporter receptor subunit TctC